MPFEMVLECTRIGCNNVERHVELVVAKNMAHLLTAL